MFSEGKVAEIYCMRWFPMFQTLLSGVTPADNLHQTSIFRNLYGNQFCRFHSLACVATNAY
jgi:hypothetical protein